MNPSNNLFKIIISKIKNANGKRALLAIIMAIIIIAPTVLALTYVIQNELVKEEILFSVSLYNESDELLAQESGSPDVAEKGSLTNIFYNLITDQKPPKALPQTTDVIKVKIAHNEKSYDLLCYFSTLSDEGYYTDQDGNTYLIPEKINSAFLLTEYAEMLYPTACVYELVTIDKDVITPKFIEWSFLGVNGIYLSAKNNKITDKIKTYEITGAIDINFTSAPDTTRVQVYNNDNLVHFGDIESLSTLSIDTHDTLRIYIEAVWENNGERENYGEVHYEFYAKIKNRSSFYLNKQEVSAGSFLILDCTNISDASKIVFVSDREGFTPKFYRYNNLWRTIIPFSADETDDSFEFTVSYGASVESFKVKITEANKIASYTFEALTFADPDTPTMLNKQTEATILSLAAVKNDTVYFRGNFLSPEAYGYTVSYTHDSEIKWGDGENTYTALGAEYTCSGDNLGGNSVVALENGIVTYVGENDLLGKFVLIDHGCGLRTLYAGLGSIDVEFGDLLMAGEHIGKTSRSGICNEEAFKLYCILDQALIDPQSLPRK